MGNIIKGKKLMVFLKENDVYKSIGYSTSHSFSSSASTIDISHKDMADAGSGKWDDQDIDTLSWTISSESFFANTADGFTSKDIFNLYANGTVVELKFGLTEDSATGVPTDGWTPKSGSFLLSGKGVITSYDINAGASDNATMSITITGKGKITAE